MTAELEVLFRSPDVLVRLMVLDGREISPHHHHSVMSESVVCVEGTIAFHAPSRGPAVILDAGRSVAAGPGIVHWLENPTDAEARYILVQHGGPYDFVVAPS